jgi:GNAT superfamily N-acetyltransferase
VIEDIHVRTATASDVPAMADCRLTDPAAGSADSRMAAYFDGRHHPQEALPPRTGFIALAEDAVVGYIAGHLTTRHGCAGEVQYLFMAPAYRRRGIATALLRHLAEWFQQNAARKVCVCVDGDSPAAEPFYDSVGAVPFRRYWREWEDIDVVLG